MGLFRSDDRGATWCDTEIGRFSPLTYCHDVVSPHDPRVLYTCLSPANFSGDLSLYCSDDLAQKPHPPIWVGGHSRVASPLPPQEMRTHLETWASACTS
jgi:hypothetical protein